MSTELFDLEANEKYVEREDDFDRLLSDDQAGRSAGNANIAEPPAACSHDDDDHGYHIHCKKVVGIEGNFRPRSFGWNWEVYSFLYISASRFVVTGADSVSVDTETGSGKTGAFCLSVL